ncbi:MAG: ABC transporter ATP-binding protein [Desulfobulbaceae bacterium]|nr:ABC transporter ATP-binding protein [Desulfobulbaceae bacterium]
MLIECRQLNKNYISDNITISAVNNVNLSIRRGEFSVILGHSGSGKTTLLSLIGGLTIPDSGEVLINGVENWSQSDEALSDMRNTRIGFIFQFASLIPTLTAMENILLPLSFGRNPKGNYQKAREILELVGLKDKANSFPSQLSGGQQRRIAIARAFINEPDIILADEPTGDLDEVTEKEILQIFKEYNSRGTTFVVVTHNVHLVESQVSGRIFHMRQGILTEEGSAVGSSDAAIRGDATVEKAI